MRAWLFGAVLVGVVPLGAASQAAPLYDFRGSQRQSVVLDPGTYDIVATGASGGDANGFVGGAGLVIDSLFTFDARTFLELLIGNAGNAGAVGVGGGGGGGTFIVENTRATGLMPLLIAAGGGGAGASSDGGTGQQPVSTTDAGGAAGIGRGGGGGGGGLRSSGVSSDTAGGGAAYTQGGVGGTDDEYPSVNVGHGGLGGGGAGGFNGFGGAGGGGGGYAGGAGGAGIIALSGPPTSGDDGGGAGGFSFNAGFDTRYDLAPLTGSGPFIGSGSVTITLVPTQTQPTGPDPASPTTVPEPASMVLLGGLLCVHAAQRQRKRERPT